MIYRTLTVNAAVSDVRIIDRTVGPSTPDGVVWNINTCVSRAGWEVVVMVRGLLAVMGTAFSTYVMPVRKTNSCTSDPDQPTTTARKVAWMSLTYKEIAYFALQTLKKYEKLPVP